MKLVSVNDGVDQMGAEPDIMEFVEQMGVTWVSPFLACAAGGGAAKATAMVMTPAASDAATVFHFTAGPPSTGRVMLD